MQVHGFGTMVMATMAALALGSIAVAGDSVNSRSQLTSDILAEVNSNTRGTTDKCKRSGCSGEVCADANVITPCIWRPEYRCYKKALCEMQSNGTCGWTLTSDLQACLSSKRLTGRVVSP
jgi:eight-cysteine-cluster-containing protein